MYKGLTKLKTKEEYEAKKTELKYYVDEYTWITSSKEPLKDITMRMREMLDGLEKEENQENQLGLLKNIHVLQVKYTSVKKGEYISDLKQDITAALVLIEQYEATLEKHSPAKVAVGVLTGNPEIKSYLQRRYRVASANRNYAAPNAIDLRMEKIEDILNYIDKNYNLVEIKVPKMETGLVPVNTEIDNPVQRQIQEMTEAFLSERVKIHENEAKLKHNDKSEISQVKDKSKYKGKDNDSTKHRDDGKEI